MAVCVAGNLEKFRCKETEYSQIILQIILHFFPCADCQLLSRNANTFINHSVHLDLDQSSYSDWLTNCLDEFHFFLEINALFKPFLSVSFPVEVEFEFTT